MGVILTTIIFICAMATSAVALVGIIKTWTDTSTEEMLLSARIGYVFILITAFFWLLFAYLHSVTPAYHTHF